MKRYFTSESVTEGHPDKICDQISDAILDKILLDDPSAHVACEVCIKHDLLVIMGEIQTSGDFSEELIIDTAKTVICEIGYTDGSLGFDIQNSRYEVSINEQSADINEAVSKVDGIGAGDQGVMIGFACTDTEDFMPLPISMAHRLTRRMDELRKSNHYPFLRPDGKAQVTVVYEDDVPVYIDTIIVSSQHSEEISLDNLRAFIIENVIKEVIPRRLISKAHTRYLINPGGKFINGGPKADSGLTGRKIMVDTYGGYARHGGGAFSGKDLTKVDRSASYMARYVAKNLVKAELARKCEVEISYAIGEVEPIHIQVNTFGTGDLPDDVLTHLIASTFDFSPIGMIEKLSMRKPNYRMTARCGHFGESEERIYPWEEIDMSQALADKVQCHLISIDEWFMKLNPENIQNLSREELFGYVRSRPGHDSAYGFSIPGHLMINNLDSAEILYLLMQRLSEYSSEAISQRIREYQERRELLLR